MRFDFNFNFVIFIFIFIVFGCPTVAPHSRLTRVSLALMSLVSLYLTSSSSITITITITVITGEVTDAGIASLHDLEHLQSVDVTNCHGITFDGLMALKWCRGRENQVLIASSFMSRLFE